MDDNAARKRNLKLVATALGCVLLTASCATSGPTGKDTPLTGLPASPAHRSEPVPTDTTVRFPTPVDTDTAPPDRAPAQPSITLGTGVFVGPSAADQATATHAEGDVTLNFEEASLREFIGVVFDKILRKNYLIDPQVKGVVTLHTTLPVTQDAVLPIVETVLQLNGAALVHDQGIFKVIPLAGAEAQATSPTVGKKPATGATGYAVQIVPLEHVAASEMEKVLKPFVPQGSAMRIDAARNLLILSGPQYRLDQILETVKLFDVDWLKGMSFGLFTLQYADAAVLVGELENVIGSQGQAPLTGIVRLTPIERLNAILVVAHTPQHMTKIQQLIEQFDWGREGSAGRRLYVYHLKYGKAENIAGVLQHLYTEGASGAEPLDGAGIAQLPPGQGVNAFQTAGALSAPPPPVGAPGAGGDYQATAPQVDITPPTMPDAGPGTTTEASVNIIADQDNNAILVMAGPQDYRAIEGVIRQLDIRPRQVLIDATIAEVTLSNGLDYGVRWFLESNNLQLGFNAPPPTQAAGDGLTLAIFRNGGDVRMFVDTLATETSVKFLSAPQVMVLDNQTASIRVGDQIPVTTRTAQSTTDPDAPIVSEVQFRDTGTLLSVTPRINLGGQVTLDISQEVSLPGSEPAVGGGGNVAISQRTIDSSVVIQSGQTVVLGGLMLETANDAKSGIPLLMDIPWLGKLFSTTSKDTFRTELIVMITPQVIEDQNAAQQATEELRRKLSKPAAFERAVKKLP
jgi:general secretion pathway protein D